MNSLLGAPRDMRGNTAGEVDKMPGHKGPCMHTNMNAMDQAMEKYWKI